MRSWLFAIVIIGCARTVPPTKPRIACTDCSSTSAIPEAFATHTKLHVHASWDGDCEADIVVDGDKSREVCKQIPNDTTVTCDGCVVARLGGDRYAVTLAQAGNVTVRGNFRPAETRRPEAALLGPIRVVKPTRAAAKCRRLTAQEATVTVELFADTVKLASNRPSVGGSNASCVDDSVSDRERLAHRYRCATPTDAPAIELVVKTPDFSSTTTVPCTR